MSDCCVCKKLVRFVEQKITFEENVYHAWCFQCTNCQLKLTSASACSYANMPYCLQHVPATNDPTADDIHNTKEHVLLDTSSNTHDNPETISTSQLESLVEINPNPLPTIDRRSTALDSLETISKLQLESPADTNPNPLPPVDPRSNALGNAYAIFKSQVELAAKNFTIDPVTRSKLFSTFNEFNVIICGPPKVGKSTLINAICGHKQAKAHVGLDSCTKEIRRYVLKGKHDVDGEIMEYIYNFWDTPGFESWGKADIEFNFNLIMSKPKSDPLCMIFCASPGAFANTQQIAWVLDVCVKRHIFCALVVTNKWAGQQSQRLGVLGNFKELLSKYAKQTGEETDGVTHFGNTGLCTMINAEPYIDLESNLNKPQEGINELINGIILGLGKEEKVFHWCMIAIQNKGFVSNVKAAMTSAVGKVTSAVGKVTDYATDWMNYLINAFQYEDTSDASVD